MPSHMHSHLHRRHGGAVQDTKEMARDVSGKDEEHHHHHHDDDNDGSDNGGLSTPDRLEMRDSDDGTDVSIVYVTAPATFSGEIAGFTTLGVEPSPSPAPVVSSQPPVVVPPKSSAPAPADTPTPSPSAAPAPTTTEKPAQPLTTAQSSSLLKTIQTHSTDPSSSTSTLVVSSVPSSSASLVDTAVGAAATTQAPSTTVNNDSLNSGLSGGAKAGIAIGVILGVLALAAAVFALLRLKKRRDEENFGEAMTEKSPFGDHAAVPPPAPTARQMVQSQAPVLPPMGISAAAPVYGTERRAESPTNPFGPGAETIRDVPSSAGSAGPTSISGADKAGLGAGAAVAAGGIAAATIAKRTSVPAPLKINRSQSPALAAPAQPSPAMSNFSDASLASSAVTGSAAGGAGPKMHRVQMDFNPTMDDELGIGAGEIVEILHEYDDGWCLCKIVRRNKEGASRVDRGVAPRTCLSRLPLKPRNPGQKRQGPPPAGAPRSESPAPPPSAATPAPLNTVPRAASPALNASPAKRSVSPGPYGGGPQTKEDNSQPRSRSNSMSDLQHARKDGPGPSPMNPDAKKVSKDFSLPIQVPAAEAAATEVNSVPSTPVTRKPVPKSSE